MNNTRGKEENNGREKTDFNMFSLLPHVTKLLNDVENFFKGKGFKFHKTEIEQIGKNKYLRITVSIKID